MPIIPDLMAYFYGPDSSLENNSRNPSTQDTPTSQTHLDKDHSETLLLPDGRTLGYAQYGSLTGRTVIYLHGHPGSRLEGAHLHDLGLKLGARIVAPDRPGSGLSSPKSDRKMLDYSKDVEYLADHLQLECYGVLVRAALYFRASITPSPKTDFNTGSIGWWPICARLRLFIT
jgi:hypothetical protein